MRLQVYSCFFYSINLFPSIPSSTFTIRLATITLRLPGESTEEKIRCSQGIRGEFQGLQQRLQDRRNSMDNGDRKVLMKMREALKGQHVEWQNSMEKMEAGYDSSYGPLLPHFRMNQTPDGTRMSHDSRALMRIINM